MKPPKAVRARKPLTGQGPRKERQAQLQTGSVRPSPLLPIPAMHDFNIADPGIPTLMFANGVHANHVSIVLGSAALTRRGTRMLLEVKCINKNDRHDPHERIRSIGGPDWKHTQQQAIAWIENGTFRYYVNQGGHPVDVIVATSPHGHKYLKTTADGEHPNNLLSLPECAS